MQTAIETETNLGWANGWTIKPPILAECHAKGHKRTDIDVGPFGRGLEHVVRCDICKYVYRYDSSD